MSGQGPPRRGRAKGAVRVLFVCSQNRLRSPTAERVFSHRAGIEVASAGLDNDAVQPITPELLEWAQIIFVMERAHRNKLSKKYRASLAGRRVVCLEIPDDFEYMEPALVRLLETRVLRHLPPARAGEPERSAAPGLDVMRRPDFSGTWRYDPGRSVLQIPAPDSLVFRVDHREPLIRISRTYTAGGKSDTFTLDLTTDGEEVTLDRGDLRLRARAYWDGESLVFDSTAVRGGVEGTNWVRYSLAADLGSFVAEERFRSESLNYDNTWVLDRARPDLEPGAWEG